jgi:hypothetical protein
MNKTYLRQQYIETITKNDGAISKSYMQFLLTMSLEDLKEQAEISVVLV